MSVSDDHDRMMARIAAEEAERASRPGLLDEPTPTDPGERPMAMPPDNSETVPHRQFAEVETELQYDERLSSPSRSSANPVDLAHTVHHGDLLERIRDNTKSSADADVELVRLARDFLWHLKAALYSTLVLLGLGLLGLMFAGVFGLIVRGGM